MATLAKKQRKNGTAYEIYFYLDGERRYLSLGMKYTKALAEEVKIYVGRVARLVKSGDGPDRKTAAWLDEMSDDLRERFVKAGLIEPPKTIAVGELFDRFTDSTPNRKDSTLRTYETVAKRFLRFFDAELDAGEITKEGCLEWLDSLADEYAPASIAGCVQRCRTVFAWAVSEGYIDANPFKAVPRGSFQNKDREHFVTRKDFDKLLDACPDQDWRTLLALCRFGGLRNPSETLRLQWSDVNWEKGFMRVTSPKTEAYIGKDSRIVPLFPELRAELDQQFD